MPNKKPDDYQSKWKDQLSSKAGDILNRKDFTYDVNSDALYQQMVDQYTQQGKQAMMDTMGQAAAMTGGYSNSYAQSVGQQTYQKHLQGLNDMVPDLYQMALDNYIRQGDAMYDQFAMLDNLEDMDYGRYRDQMADYFADRDFEYQAQRDQITDQQWQKEFDEMVRQYNQNYALSASKASGGGSSGSRSSSGGKSSGSGNSEAASKYGSMSYTQLMQEMSKAGTSENGAALADAMIDGGADFETVMSLFKMFFDHDPNGTENRRPSKNPNEYITMF